jgi:hypothetical protein
MKSIILCLELQFDTVIADRPIILQILFKLYSSSHHFKAQVVLTWEFFMQRFNTLSLEAQLIREQNGGDVLSPVDICGISTNSSRFQQKLYLARFALLRTHFVRKINSSLNLFRSNNEQENRPQTPNDEDSEKVSTQKDQTEQLEGINRTIIRSLISILMKVGVSSSC